MALSFSDISFVLLNEWISRLYGDLWTCIVISMNGMYNCDLSGLKRLEFENQDYITSLLGFHPHQCTSKYD